MLTLDTAASFTYACQWPMISSSHFMHLLFQATSLYYSTWLYYRSSNAFWISALERSPALKTICICSLLDSLNICMWGVYHKSTTLSPTLNVSTDLHPIPKLLSCLVWYNEEKKHARLGLCLKFRSFGETRDTRQQIAHILGVLLLPCHLKITHSSALRTWIHWKMRRSQYLMLLKAITRSTYQTCWKF